MMNDQSTDMWLRLALFIGVLLTMLCWETIKPNRQSPVAKAKRWLSNLALVVLATGLIRLVFPAGLAATAIWAEQHQVGVFNQWPIALFWSVLGSVLLLDCLIYWQHRLFHRLPWLWRLHQVHHADPHVDSSTGLRFHPFEILLSLLIKVGAVLVLGAPVLAILIFEIVLNARSLFNHTNVKLPQYIEVPLRKLIVTQAMHRIHHSQDVRETDSNFSFNLSIWDRVFGTYTAAAKLGDDGLKLGLKKYDSEQTNTRLGALLTMPFRNKSN